MKENPLGTVTSVTKTSNLSDACNKFVKSISEQVIVLYCSLSETIAAKSQVASQNNEREEREKQRLKDYENLIGAVFEITSGELKAQFNMMRTGLAKVFEEKSAPVPEGAESTDKWDGVNDQYERLSSFVSQLFEINSGFVSIVTLYVQTFGVFKLKPSLLPVVCHSSLALLSEISSFNTLMKSHSEKVTSYGADGKDRLKTFFD